MADRVTGAGSVMFAESVSRALSGALGRADAQDVVAAAARAAEQTGTPFREVLRGRRPRHRAPGRRRARGLLRPGRPRPGRRRPGRPDPVPQDTTGGPMTIALAHDVRGDDAAPALVLGSSLGTTRAMWDPQHEALAAAAAGGALRPPRPRRVTGSGGRDAPWRTSGRSVLELADRLELQRFSYAGLSLGGMVGMWLAIHAPERVDRLALLCTSAYLPPAPDVARAGRRGARGRHLCRHLASRWSRAGSPRSSRQRRPDVVASFTATLDEVDPEGYAACCEVIAVMDQRARSGPDHRPDTGDRRRAGPAPPRRRATPT